MDVDLFAQVFFGHLRAFDVPPRTPFAPGRFPGGLSFLFGLPEYKIQGIFLLILPGHKEGAVSGTQIVQILMGELPILRKFPGAVVHGAVLFIGKALVDQRPDHLDHAADLLCGKGMHRGRPYIHPLHVLFALLNVAVGNLLCRYPFFQRLLDDLVIHIGKIGHKIHIIPFILKIPAHRIEYDHGPGVSDVDKIIDGGPAHVHPDLIRFQRDELLFFL